jgi:hypothetical protein
VNLEDLCCLLWSQISGRRRKQHRAIVKLRRGRFMIHSHRTEKPQTGSHGPCACSAALVLMPPLPSCTPLLATEKPQTGSPLIVIVRAHAALAFSHTCQLNCTPALIVLTSSHASISLHALSSEVSETGCWIPGKRPRFLSGIDTWKVPRPSGVLRYACTVTLGVRAL